MKAIQPSEAVFILPKTLNKISLNTLQDKLPKHNSENIQITINSTTQTQPLCIYTCSLIFLPIDRLEISDKNIY